MSLGVGSFAASGSVAELPDPAFTWIGQKVNTNAQSSYSFTLDGLGADYADRYVLVAARFTRAGASNPSSWTITLAGQVVTPVSDPWTTAFPQALFLIKVPAGASISASFSFNIAVQQLTLAYAVLTDLESMAPVTHGRASANNPSVNVNIPDKGIAFGYWTAGYGVSPGTNSWSSPMIMDLNNNISTQFRHSVGHRVATGVIASYNVQHFFNYTGYLSAAVFR